MPTLARLADEGTSDSDDAKGSCSVPAPRRAADHGRCRATHPSAECRIIDRMSKTTVTRTTTEQKSHEQYTKPEVGSRPNNESRAAVPITQRQQLPARCEPALCWLNEFFVCGCLKQITKKIYYYNNSNYYARRAPRLTFLLCAVDVRGFFIIRSNQYAYSQPRSCELDILSF